MPNARIQNLFYSGAIRIFAEKVFYNNIMPTGNEWFEHVNSLSYYHILHYLLPFPMESKDIRDLICTHNMF